MSLPISDHVREELEGVLKDWKSGKPVRSLQLGHTQQEEDQPDGSRRIALTGPLYHDQAKIHAFSFELLELCLKENFASVGEFEDSVRKTIARFPGLTFDEYQAGASLAWKALIQGWKRALDGHKDSDYITVSSR